MAVTHYLSNRQARLATALVTVPACFNILQPYYTGYVSHDSGKHHHRELAA